MKRKGEELSLSLAGVPVSHPDKIWWPKEKITKGDVARLYAEISPRIVPWIKNRPLTAERCPDGMRGECFYQKDFTRGLPQGVRRIGVKSESAGKVVHYPVGSKKALIALVNLGCIAVHVMNCRTGSLDEPDWLAFDLDPQTGRFADAARAGRELRRLLDEEGIFSFPKTSGGRGLHVFVPLRRVHTQDEVRSFAERVGRLLAARRPQLVTVGMSKKRRGRRVFADSLRNAFGQTIVAPYSVRRRERAPVSTPLDWSEVAPRLDPAAFNLTNFPSRLKQRDPWADFWKRRQRLPRA